MELESTRVSAAQASQTITLRYEYHPALVALTGHRLGGRPLGLVAGLLAALYLPFAWAASVALSDLTGAFLMALQVLLAVRVTSRDDPPAAGWYVALGLTSAALGLVRPVYALWGLVPLAPPSIVTSRVSSPIRGLPSSRRRRGRR